MIWGKRLYRSKENISHKTPGKLDPQPYVKNDKMPIDLAHKDNVPSTCWGYVNDQEIQGAQPARISERIFH